MGALIEEHVLISDTFAVRGLITIASLRRWGIQARAVDPSAWATREASVFLVAFDTIGRERVRVLRRRFPNTPILSYGDNPRDGESALRFGADEHLPVDPALIAEHIIRYSEKRRARSGGAKTLIDELIKQQRDGERGHIAPRF